MRPTRGISLWVVQVYIPPGGPWDAALWSTTPELCHMSCIPDTSHLEWLFRGAAATAPDRPADDGIRDNGPFSTVESSDAPDAGDIAVGGPSLHPPRRPMGCSPVEYHTRIMSCIPDPSHLERPLRSAGKRRVNGLERRARKKQVPRSKVESPCTRSSTSRAATWGLVVRDHNLPTQMQTAGGSKFLALRGRNT